jgi:hypothetical protein
VTLRRPSAPIVIALLALFVALDGPAHAQRLINGKLLKKGTVTSRAVKDRSLQVKDIKRKSVRKLQKTRNGSITEAKLANSSVTPGKLAPGAVGSSAIADRGVGGTDLAPSSVGGLHVADGSLGGADVADGALDARDLGRYWGRFSVDLPEDIAANSCWSGEPTGLGPELAGADISQDLVLVTPGQNWPEKKLAFSVRNSAIPSRFVISACNVTGALVPKFMVNFRYLVVDLP